jgi:hypothetical protein
VKTSHGSGGRFVSNISYNGRIEEFSGNTARSTNFSTHAYSIISRRRRRSRRSGRRSHPTTTGATDAQF